MAGTFGGGACTLSVGNKVPELTRALQQWWSLTALCVERAGAVYGRAACREVARSVPRRDCVAASIQPCKWGRTLVVCLGYSTRR